MNKNIIMFLLFLTSLKRFQTKIFYDNWSRERKKNHKFYINRFGEKKITSFTIIGIEKKNQKL